MGAALALAALMLVTGCGFRPLYATPDMPSSVANDLARIKVQTIPDRIGQKVRNQLIADFESNGEALAPLYSLNVTLSIAKQELGLRITEEATRARLTLTATFVLTDLRTGEPLYQGSTRSANSYNVSESNYATLAAEQDALDRAARVVAEEIQLRLGLHFDRQSG